jgi:hypothetical protein
MLGECNFGLHHYDTPGPNSFHFLVSGEGRLNLLRQSGAYRQISLSQHCHRIKVLHEEVPAHPIACDERCSWP